MALKTTRYAIALAGNGPDGEDTVVTVPMNHGDQLRAELEMRKHGITDAQAFPLHFLTICLWAAALRAGVPGVTSQYKDFEAQLQGFEEGVEETVPPTQPATPAGSPSSSPATSADSLTGSTPPPTSD